MNIYYLVQEHSRTKRANLFKFYFPVTTRHRILDLGSGDGSLIASIVSYRENVFIADISREKLEVGCNKFGFKTVLLEENGTLDFPDRYFDVVFCNSVIEHVTLPKAKVYTVCAKEFASLANEGQQRFAREIRRVARGYFVETPNKYFPIESHTGLPFILLFLPRKLFLRILWIVNQVWPKKTFPDWKLLSAKQMAELFPDATIYRERLIGLTKSLIAVRSYEPPPTE